MTEQLDHIDWQHLRDKLTAFVRQRVSTDDDARDIVSIALEKLLIELNKGSSPDNINAWLYQVTRNSIVDFYRSRNKIDSLAHNQLDSLASEDSEKTVLESLSQCMIPLIQHLPDHYKQPILLSEIEGLTHKQVAERLGLSLSAVKSRILRGREKLLEKLQRCCALHRDTRHNVVDFTQKSPDSCDL